MLYFFKFEIIKNQTFYMDFVKQQHLRLAQIIDNCNSTELQFSHLKKSLDQEFKMSHFNLFSHPQRSQSISLLKNSRIHMENFQKSQQKISSLHSNSNFLDSQQLYMIKDSQNIQKRKLDAIGNRRLKQNKLKINQKEKENSPQQRQTSQRKTKLNQIIKQSLSTTYLPQINSCYTQTFSPKNASLSQETLVKRQLERSIYKKNYEQKCKKYQKENMIREYESKNKKIEQKMQMYRLNILKKISYQNVKKYLFDEKKIKEAHAMF